jgi:hypothetical protein
MAVSSERQVPAPLLALSLDGLGALYRADPATPALLAVGLYALSRLRLRLEQAGL